MVSSIYKKTFSVLMKRPFRLWGISLLAEFLCLVAYAGFIGVPAAAFCAALLLSALLYRTAVHFRQGRLLICAPFLFLLINRLY